MAAGKLQNLPKILYDQTQYTPVWMIDAFGINISDAIYFGARAISGYAPDGWILYTQNQPDSFFFGAYDEEALKKEGEVGFSNFNDPRFLQNFEKKVERIYGQTKKLRKEYFKNFFKHEKEIFDEHPVAIVAFFKKAHALATELMSYYLLTQPQRFYKIENELSLALPNKDLELVSTNGHALTYVSKMRKAIIDAANAGGSMPKSAIENFGFLNWGYFGGDLVTEETASKEIEVLLNDHDKLRAETEEMNSLTQLIEKRNKLIKENDIRGMRLADVIGRSSVFRFDLQTCFLCIVKYIANFLEIAGEKNNLAKDEVDSYGWNELLDLIGKGAKLDVGLFKARQTGYLRIYSNEHSQTFEGVEAREKIKDLLDFRQREISASKSVKGAVASFPKHAEQIIHGTAFVLTSAFGAEEEIKKFADGQILIATQTHPNLVPYMKKALAIITDEGGVTCHAAIVSREIGKPCIIGTRLATKVVKTGDEVILNMKTGEIEFK